MESAMIGMANETSITIKRELAAGGTSATATLTVYDGPVQRGIRWALSLDVFIAGPPEALLAEIRGILDGAPYNELPGRFEGRSALPPRTRAAIVNLLLDRLSG